ncbi:hypothetical protein [Actinoplanes sp. M2I2]|uniref:hypothetical protein n=1 Tax=Actinoplanes sp. M2I2 TaxID=1734444 RepID=UPI002020C784|nr:hypothetical protein [Actinoplanes sp. M2I2]
MKKSFPAGRRLASAALAGLLTLVATTVALIGGSPAFAAADGWYMLMNDYYDGDVGDGKRHCLSANGDTSPSGAGTHKVYLAVCNAATIGQWWYIYADWASVYGRTTTITNRQTWDGFEWELSGNTSTPSGGASGTYGAYTAANNPISSHQWDIKFESGTNRFRLENDSSGYQLSTSAADPYAGNLYRVYTSSYNFSSPAPAQVWRLYAPSSPPS